MSGTGFVWHEKYMWHDTGNALGVLPSSGEFEPWVHFENPETKRRIKNLFDAYGVTEKLTAIQPLPASTQHGAAVLSRWSVHRMSASRRCSTASSAPRSPLLRRRCKQQGHAFAALACRATAS